MRRIRIHRDIGADPTVLWDLLTLVEHWPAWGPTVRGVELDGERIGPDSVGHVVTPLGVRLPFAVTDFDDGASWAWEVGGVPATDHTVAPRPDGCRVGFGVPWFAAPYLAVCRIALGRLERLATTT